MRAKHPPFIKANLYAVTDVMLVIALLLFLIAIFEKDKMVKLMMIGFSSIPAGIACFSVGVQVFHGKTTVKNRSKNSICAKHNGKGLFVNAWQQSYNNLGANITN